MPTPLKQLKIAEVSAVGKGANPHAFIRLFKSDQIETIRAEFPDLCRGLDAAAVAKNLGGRMAKAVATDAEVTASLISQLADISSDMKDQPGWLVSFSAAIHRHAEQLKAKMRRDLATSARQLEPPADPTPTRKATTASASAAELTSGGVQHLFDLEVAKIAKRDKVGRGEAMDRLRKTEAGAKLWRALDDKSIATGPAPQPNVPGPESEHVRKHIREAEERQASTARLYMDLLAKGLRDSEAEAGRQISHEQAFAKIYEDPKNAVLQLRLRVEEGRA